jgi:hypothetical protein
MDFAFLHRLDPEQTSEIDLWISAQRHKAVDRKALMLISLSCQQVLSACEAKPEYPWVTSAPATASIAAAHSSISRSLINYQMAEMAFFVAHIPRQKTKASLSLPSIARSSHRTMESSHLKLRTLLASPHMRLRAAHRCLSSNDLCRHKQPDA